LSTLDQTKRLAFGIDDAPSDLTPAEREARRIILSRFDQIPLDPKERAVFAAIRRFYYFLWDGDRPHNYSGFRPADEGCDPYWTLYANNRKMTERSTQNTLKKVAEYGGFRAEAVGRTSDGRGSFTRWAVFPSLYKSLMDDVVRDHWKRALISERESISAEFSYYRAREETADSVMLKIFQISDRLDNVLDKFHAAADYINWDLEARSQYQIRSDVERTTSAINAHVMRLTDLCDTYKRICDDSQSKMTMTRYLASIKPGEPFDPNGPSDD